MPGTSPDCSKPLTLAVPITEAVIPWYVTDVLLAAGNVGTAPPLIASKLSPSIKTISLVSTPNSPTTFSNST